MSHSFFKVSLSFALLASLVCLSASLCVPVQAQTIIGLKGHYFQTLFTFDAITGYNIGNNAENGDGARPFDTLISGSDGNLYGTTSIGGVNGFGTIFRFAPDTTTLTTLYEFSAVISEYPYVNSDGVFPGGSLVMDSHGNLYGAAANGGANGSGTLFKYSTTTGFTTLYTFSAVNSNGDNSDGAAPCGSLIIDSQGNLYGATTEGGANNTGTIFKYSTTTDIFTTLHTFSAYNSSDENSDGVSPSPLIMDSAGNLYGTTDSGGAHATGTLFEFSPATNTFTTLYNFSAYNSSYENSDGANPNGGLLMDSYGNLYGAAIGGGANNRGTIFEYTSTTNTFTILHTFSATTEPGLVDVNEDGAGPNGGLVLDRFGNLYGTTNNGGANGNGTVFQYTLATDTFAVLHTFSPRIDNALVNSDGIYPTAGLFMDSQGNLYGTANEGGANGIGTIFALHPIYEVVPPHGTHPPHKGTGVSSSPGGNLSAP